MLQKTFKYHFVYPWVKGEDRIDELKYSLRSLEKNFKEPFEVFIVGDLPEWICNVHHIPAERQTGMFENVAYDAIYKILKVCDCPDVNSYFIRMYDDIYLLQEMGFREISVIRALYDWSKKPAGDGTPSLTWQRQRDRTMAALQAKGHPTWNTETHLPEVYLKSVLKWVLEEFNALENRYLISSLYHNVVLCNSEKPKIISKATYDKAGFYGVNSEFSYSMADHGAIMNLLLKKLFLNHNNPGLSPGLEVAIKDYFHYKSKFEK